MNEKLNDKILEDDSLEQVNGGGILSEVGKLIDQIEDQIDDRIQQTIEETVKRQNPF
ncbi:MAG: hypothetical protein K5770_17805 [Lachnospiraceae bacterium]|nr:hypothetical protein [Lachnospiraceae bacterium]